MTPEKSRHVRVETVEGVTVVTPDVPQIDAELKDELYEAAAAAGPGKVVLDLEHVRQVNSAAIGILVNFQKRVREAGGALKVCGIAATVRDVFLLTRMDQVLDLAGSRREAFDGFAGKTDAGPTGGGGGGEGGSWVSRLFGGK